MARYPDMIEYSEKYSDDKYEYRHVILTKEMAQELWRVSHGRRLLQDSEWRGLGVQGGPGWAHYAIHQPEPHILLFRRPAGAHGGQLPVDSIGGRSTRSRQNS